jgi:hypothetical protein
MKRTQVQRRNKSFLLFSCNCPAGGNLKPKGINHEGAKAQRRKGTKAQRHHEGEIFV